VEEVSLINSLSEMVSSFLDRRVMEDVLKENLVRLTKRRPLRIYNQHGYS
jgi:hypothetical protein